jgi:maltodextrin utilization protein YvdJ
LVLTVKEACGVLFFVLAHLSPFFFLIQRYSALLCVIEKNNKGEKMVLIVKVARIPSLLKREINQARKDLRGW